MKVRLKRAAPGRGTITIIAALLASSAILRLGPGAGSAVAEAVLPLQQASEQGTAPQAPAGEPDKMDRVGLGRLLAALKEREARVAEREEQIEMRGKALSVADEEIARRMEALAEMEENLRRTLALADGAVGTIWPG